MEQSTDCPAHGGIHANFACPDLRRVKQLLGLKYEDLKKWMGFPHPDLEGRTPQDVINSGHVGAVLTLLENARMGIPS